MKLAKILPLLPIIGLLCSCSQPEVKVPDAQKMLKEELTAAPVDFVVYPDDRPSIPDGKFVWESAEKGNCASCHGATGAGGNGPALNDPAAMAQKKPVEQYKFITFGKDPHHKMQDKLTNREIWNLVFYTRSLATPPLTTAEMDAVSPVFGANCAVCHGTKGDGDGPLARNLEPWPANFQTFSRFYDRSDNTLFDHIANGIKWEGMPNFLGKEDKKKNVKFDHAYIKKLVQYVRNFHVSNEPTMVANASGATPAATPAATSTGTSAPSDQTSAPSPASTEGDKKPADTTAQPESNATKGDTAPDTKAPASTETKAAPAGESKAGSTETKPQ